MTRQSLRLAMHHWRNLDLLAAATQSRVTRGTNIGGFSWRSMIRRIASGELHIEEAGHRWQHEPDEMPAGVLWTVFHPSYDTHGNHFVVERSAKQLRRYAADMSGEVWSTANMKAKRTWEASAMDFRNAMNETNPISQRRIAVDALAEVRL